METNNKTSPPPKKPRKALSSQLSQAYLMCPLNPVISQRPAYTVDTVPEQVFKNDVEYTAAEDSAASSMQDLIPALLDYGASQNKPCDCPK